MVKLATSQFVPRQSLSKSISLVAMNWIYAILLVGAIIAFLLIRRGKQISAKDAKEFLKQGALVIDVRSAGEYTAGHLQRAINIPLSEIETAITRKTKDQDQVLLLHCQSGARSSAAVKKLRALGYEKAYNLGGYGRAAQIVGAR